MLLLRTTFRVELVFEIGKAHACLREKLKISDKSIFDCKQDIHVTKRWITDFYKIILRFELWLNVWLTYNSDEYVEERIDKKIFPLYSSYKNAPPTIFSAQLWCAQVSKSIEKLMRQIVWMNLEKIYFPIVEANQLESACTWKMQYRY